MSEIKPSQYIASCSFGKDSLAAIISRMERGEPVDGAIYCRIMFDSETSAELPEHEAWIHGYAIPLLKSRYGIDTAIVQADRTYVDMFYKYYQRGIRQGKQYGFPLRNGPWCNSMLKVSPIRRYQKAQGDHVVIAGIASDEVKRIPRALQKGFLLPLVEHGITEAEAMEICRENDLLSPAYNSVRQRLGCWFCHNQCVGEYRQLRKDYPELWSKLLALDKDSWRQYTARYSVASFDERFAAEDAQIKLDELW